MSSLVKEKIVVVIPTLNEEKSIGLVVENIHNVLKEYNYDILVVDGHSTDKTISIAREKGAKVVLQRGYGYGDAYLTGFRYAVRRLNAEIIVMIDGDGTYDPADIPQLLKKIVDDDVDIVVGNRFSKMKKGAMSFTNRIGNKLLSWISRMFTHIRVYDTQCGLRAFKAQLLKNISIESKGMPFALEMLIESYYVGARIAEAPVSYNPRLGGQSKLNPIRDGAKILGITLRLARDYEPLLFFGLIGIVMLTLGGLIGLRVVVEWLTTGRIVHLASAILSALLIMSGLQVVTLGLVADMIKSERMRKRKIIDD